MKRYSIKQLQKIFQDQSIQARKDNVKAIKEFKLSNPGMAIPKWLTHDFHLSDALYAMCVAIMKI